MNGAAVCSACGITRPMDALLLVTRRATGDRRFVCRPSLWDQVPALFWRPCFRGVGRASIETIELAVDAPRPAEVARHQRADMRRASVAAIAAQAVMA